MVELGSEVDKKNPTREMERWLAKNREEMESVVREQLRLDGERASAEAGEMARLISEDETGDVEEEFRMMLADTLHHYACESALRGGSLSGRFADLAVEIRETEEERHRKREGERVE